MARYHFPGHPAFLDVAAAEIGRPEAALAARRDPALAAVATLCAQAAEADLGHVSGILSEAQRLTDHLHSAHRAAELMLLDVREGRMPSPEMSPSPPAPASLPIPSRTSRRTT